MRDRIARALRWHAIALLLWSAPAAAEEETEVQTPAHRHGFWATVGGGYAVERTACTECGEDAPYRHRAGYYLEMGGVVSSQVLAAGEIFTESEEISGNATRVTHYTATAHWYPLSFPAYVKFGLGLTRGRNSFEIDGVDMSELVTGTGIMFGLGADVRLTRALSLSPIASWYLTALGDFDTSFGRAHSASGNTWFAGVGITLN